jgi:hypothetical protein
MTLRKLTGLVIGGALVAAVLALGKQSAPDVQRYRRMRAM